MMMRFAMAKFPCHDRIIKRHLIITSKTTKISSNNNNNQYYYSISLARYFCDKKEEAIIKNVGSVLTDSIPGVVYGGEKLIMFYTCKVCETRSVKKISKQAYHHGCVLVRCPSCKNLHLIADHKNVFEDGDWDIQKYLESRGETVKVVTDDSGVFELTDRDIAGSSSNILSNNIEGKSSSLSSDSPVSMKP